MAQYGAERLAESRETQSLWREYEGSALMKAKRQRATKKPAIGTSSKSCRRQREPCEAESPVMSIAIFTVWASSRRF